MRVIVTGAAGVIGGKLVETARRSGLQVIGVGRAASVPSGWAPGTWIGGDLRGAEVLKHDWAQYRGAAVLHLAADTGIYAPGRDFTSAALATAETAAAIARATGGRLVFFSSAAVYSGPHTTHPVHRLTERDDTNPASGYGRAKLAAEQRLRRAIPDAVVLRVFGVLSERLTAAPPRGNLIQAIFAALAGHGAAEVRTDEDGRPPVRDYVLDEDICRIALAAATAPAGVPRVVNVCTGSGTTSSEMVAAAAAAAGRAVPVEVTRGRRLENPVMVGDPTALSSWLGWTPRNQVQSFWQHLLRRPAGRAGRRCAAGSRGPR
jgi:dTDP-4-dehydrorhamnose reductase